MNMAIETLCLETSYIEIMIAGTNGSLKTAMYVYETILTESISTV